MSDLAPFQSDEELIAFFEDGKAAYAIHVMKRYADWASTITERFQQVKEELSDDHKHSATLQWDLSEAKKKNAELESRLTEMDGKVAQAAVVLGFSG